MTTIKEVAKEAGVSVGTVSRVLNNSGYVSEKSRKKVEDAIDKLSYQPNLVARALYHKKSRMIALIVPDINNPFFPELTRAIEDAALKYGYTIILCNSDQDPEKEKRYLDAFKRIYVDGIILASQTKEPLSRLDASTPVVALDRVHDAKLPSVTAENYRGAQAAVDLLVTKGVRKIAHIRGPKDIHPAEERLKGFLDKVIELDLPYIIEQSSFHLEEAEQVAERFYTEHPEVDGIFCSNDTIAIGFLKTALKKGINVPGDVQIVGFDGITLGKTIYPELTTISQPIYEMGKTATELILRIINEEKVENKSIELPVKVTIRGTTIA